MGDSFAAKRNSPGVHNYVGGTGWHDLVERDRRQSIRKAVSLDVEIVRPDGTAHGARVFNLSTSGMLVADLPFQPEVGEVHEFRITVDDEEIGVRGVVRRRQTIPQFGNAAGVAFLGLSDRVRNALMDVLFGVKLVSASA